jgi:hypothetical protein
MGAIQLEFPTYAYFTTYFLWTLYSFNSGHFVSTIKQQNLLFSIEVACDPCALGCALFHEVAKCSTVLSSAWSLLDHIWASGKTTPINSYLNHSHHYQFCKPATRFWMMQALIVDQLLAIQKLQQFIAFVHPNHDGCSMTKFVAHLNPHWWNNSQTACSFPDYGDLVVGMSHVIIRVHTST